MRTSVDLNDRLLTAAKQMATKRGVTLREVIEQALRAYLEPIARDRDYKVDLRITKGEVLPDAPIHDWSAFRVWLDEQ